MVTKEKNTQMRIHPKTLNLLQQSLDRFNSELQRVGRDRKDTDMKTIFRKRRNLQVAFGEAFHNRVWNAFTGEWEENTPTMLERSKKNREMRKAEISMMYPEYEKLLKKSIQVATTVITKKSKTHP
jgi:hypothetical protein